MCDSGSKGAIFGGLGVYMYELMIVDAIGKQVYLILSHREPI